MYEAISPSTVPTISPSGLSASLMPSTLAKLQVFGFGDNWLRTASSEPSRVSYSDLSILFPNLQYLYTDLVLGLEHMDWVSSWPESLIGVRFFQVFVPLPDHVRELSMYRIDDNFLRGNEMVCILPEVDKFEVFDDTPFGVLQAHYGLLRRFIESLPFSLTSLKLPPYPNGMDLTILPDTLREFHWAVPVHAKASPNVSWPLNLREATIGPVPSSLWRCLPSTLTDLTIDFQRLTTYADQDMRQHLSCLPQSLTSLRLVAPPTMFFPSDGISFPKLLRRLHVPTYVTSPTNIGTLPSTITDLSIGMMGTWHIHALPHTMTKLEIAKFQLEFRLLASLPASLTELIASLASPYPEYAGAMALLHPEPPCWPPRAAWTERWRENCESAVEAPPQLPARLTRLILLEAHQLDDWFADLLPRCLTHLELPAEASFSNRAFERLPPALTVLSLPAVHLATSHIFAALPRKLKTLDLSQLNNIENPAHIAELPRLLRTLKLSRAPLGDQHLPMLPPNLKVAYLDASNFTSCPPFTLLQVSPDAS